MLIGIIRHQVHKQERDEQHEPLIAPRAQRQEQQRPHRQEEERDLLALEALPERPHRREQHSLDDREQRIRAVIEEIAVAIGHNAVAVGSEPGRHAEEIAHCADEHRTAREQAPAPLRPGAGQSPQDHPQRNDRDIDGRVLLDHAGQHGEQGNAPHTAPVEEVKQPQQQRREEFVFVHVIARAARIGRPEQHQGAQQASRHTGQAMPPRNAPERDDRRGQQQGLQHLERHGRREQGVKRQEQIVDRRNVHGKVRQHAVALAGRHGQARRAHAVEHLGKDAEVIGRRGIAQHAEHRQRQHGHKKHGCGGRGDHKSRAAASARRRSCQALCVRPRAIGGVDEQKGQHDKPGAQQRHGPRGAQAQHELPAETQWQGRALPVRRAPAKARQRKQGKGGRRPHEQQRERLPRQGGKAAQHPFGCRQAGILYGSGQQPRQKQAPDRIPCGRAGNHTHNLTFRRDCTINAAACQTVNAPLPPKRKGGAKERKASVLKRQLFILF